MGSPVPAGATWVEFAKSPNEDLRTSLASSFLQVLAAREGFQLGSELTAEDLQTAHRTPGILVSVPQTRGANEGSFVVYATPSTFETLLSSVLTRRTSNLTGYRNVRRFWREDIAGSGLSQIVGQHLIGSLFNSLQFNIAKDTPNAISFTLGGFVADDRAIVLDDLAGDITPFPTYGDKRVYRSNGVAIDVQFADASGAFSAWTGKNSSIRSAGFQLNRGQTVEGYEPDIAVPSRNFSWTAALPGSPSGQLDLRLRFDDDSLANLTRISEIRLLRARIMMVSGSPASSTTISGALTAGTSVAVTLTDAQTFEDGDYVYLDDGTNQAVAQIASGGGTTSIVLARLDADIADAATIQDTAQQIIIPRMRLGGNPQPQPNGEILEVNMQGIMQVDESYFSSDPDNADVIAFEGYDAD